MPNPRFELAIGLIDGSNQDFTVQVDYTVNTLVVFRNGVLLERSADNGWTEMGGNAFEMKRAPKVGDVVHCFYMDTLPGTGIDVEVETEEILGIVEEEAGIAGSFESEDDMVGTVLAEGDVTGVVEIEDEFVGELVSETGITGIIEECP